MGPLLPPGLGVLHLGLVAQFGPEKWRFSGMPCRNCSQVFYAPPWLGLEFRSVWDECTSHAPPTEHHFCTSRYSPVGLPIVRPQIQFPCVRRLCKIYFVEGQTHPKSFFSYIDARVMEFMGSTILRR